MNKEIKYKVVNGTSYHEETSSEVTSVLDSAMKSRKRVKVHFGDTKTGRDWNEEHDIIGYVGRSNGSIKIPLLVYNSRSMGGGGLLDHRILKIVETKTKMVLYQHPKYQQPIVEIVETDMSDEYSHNTIVNGKLYGRHTNLQSAERLKNKLLL